MIFDLNGWLLILLAAVVNMVLGFLWYGPLFGKHWMELTGMNDKKMEQIKKKGMVHIYMLSMLSALVQSAVLSIFIIVTSARLFQHGAILGALIWLGFVATTQINSVLYDGKPWKLFGINAGYLAVVLVINGGLLATLR